MAQVPVTYRINTLNIVAILSFAVAIWAMQVLADLTIVGGIVSAGLGFAQDLVFLFWFLILRINYFNKNSATKLSLVIGLGALEVVPFLNIFPLSLIQVGSLILLSRKEDREKAKENAKKQAQKAETERRRQEFEMQLIARRSAEAA